MWIEILAASNAFACFFVEARESLVDRNHYPYRMEMQRTCRGSREPCGSKSYQPFVISLAIGVEARESLVDRNIVSTVILTSFTWSRLARALWIEIPLGTVQRPAAWSRLARALWIEIIRSHNPQHFQMSRLARALWIEIYHSPGLSMHQTSRLARALWIEIYHRWIKLQDDNVEVRESLVDRNQEPPQPFQVLILSRLARALWIEISVS